MNYDELVHRRDISVDGEKDWMWIKSDGGPDGGAFGGPAMDWEQSHNKTYFKYLNAMDAVVTAGANCGMYVRHYAKRFAVVYAFEPDPLNFHCMVNNAQFDNVIKIQAALGASNGFVVVNRLSMQNVGMHTVRQMKHAAVPMMRLDQFNFHHLDLLQLDVEGYEKDVLLGALETIKRLRPVVIIERNVGGDLLEDLGYHLAEQSKMDYIWVA